jgi:hypothetical protein
MMRPLCPSNVLPLSRERAHNSPRKGLALSVLRVTFVTVLLLIACGSDATAQVSPRFGTWKLNVERSTSVSPPKVLVRTDEPAGTGVKVTYEGIDADGSRIAYTYTAQYDGKEYRPSGVGMGNGWETIVIRSVDDYTWEATLRRAGKVVATTRNVVSKDGRTMTQTVRSTSRPGESTTSVSVWERQ